jgi:hypothetical protein
VKKSGAAPAAASGGGGNDGIKGIFQSMGLMKKDQPQVPNKPGDNSKENEKKPNQEQDKNGNENDDEDEDDDDEDDEEEEVSEKNSPPKGLTELIRGEKKKMDKVKASSSGSGAAPSGSKVVNKPTLENVEDEDEEGDDDDDDDDWSDTQSSARPAEPLGLKELMAVEKKKYDKAKQQQPHGKATPGVAGKSDPKKNLSKAIAEEAQKVKKSKEVKLDNDGFDNDEEDEDVARAYKKSIEDDEEAAGVEDGPKQSILKKKDTTQKNHPTDERRLSIKEDDKNVKEARKQNAKQPQPVEQSEEESGVEDEEEEEEEELHQTMNIKKPPKQSDKAMMDDFEVGFFSLFLFIS